MTPKQFKSARLKMGLSQAEMATLLGYTSRSMICRIETGSRIVTPRMALTVKLLMEKQNDKLEHRA